MSYQVLARKYRPRNFSEVAGQQHVLKALVNALENDRLHHAYLFTGTRGVGKTSIARILAKCLNCDNGITSEPCETCSSCVEISEGRSVDLLEVDAASNTKVEDTREMLENVQYMPSSSRFKIYLIDEVHMLSNHSFNALLKTLEEPPEHVKFLLATTEPKKLPVTVLSRCLQFNLKNLSPEKIVECLSDILKKESVSYEERSLWLLGRAADGSMRDALSLTDQAISFSESNLNFEAVKNMLGSLDQNEILELLEAVLESDGAAVLARIEALSAFSPDYSGLLSSLLSVLHRIAVAQKVPQALDNSLGDREAIESMAGRMTPEDVQLYYQIGIMGQRDLEWAPDPRSGFEMILLRMLAFEPLPALSEEKKTAENGESRAKPKKESLNKPKADASPASVSVSRQVSPLESESVEAFSPMDNDKWQKLVDLIEIEGITRTLAVNCSLESAGESNWELTLNKAHASLWSELHEARIGQALRQFFGRNLQVSVKVGKTREETPAEAREREMARRQQEAEEAIETDPNIRMLIDTFDGHLNKKSIRPLGRHSVSDAEREENKSAGDRSADIRNIREGG